MSRRKLVFMETTVQIQRVIGTQNKRDTIRASTRGQRLCTSGHVLAEYNHTLVRDAATFRNLLMTSPDVSEAVKRFSVYSQCRKFPRLVSLLATLGLDNDRDNTLDRLDDFIEWRAHDHFWEGIDSSSCTDVIRCLRRSWKPSITSNGAYDTGSLRCLKSRRQPCGVRDFIASKTVEVNRLAVAGCKHKRANVVKSAALLERLAADSQRSLGERDCHVISDALIVMEAHPKACICSTDGDVHAICAILGKKRL